LGKRTYSIEYWTWVAYSERPTGEFPRLAMGIAIPRDERGSASGMATVSKGTATRMNEWKKCMTERTGRALVGWKMNGRGLQSLGIASGSQGRYIFGKGPSQT